VLWPPDEGGRLNGMAEREGRHRAAVAADVLAHASAHVARAVGKQAAAKGERPPLSELLPDRVPGIGGAV
jgi:hypothetical protein